jgi:hypothetical protein
MKRILPQLQALNSIKDLPDLREVNTTGVNLQHQVFSHQKAVYSEDLPKMDFVAPPVKKQILEDIQSGSPSGRGTSNAMSTIPLTGPHYLHFARL